MSQKSQNERIIFGLKIKQLRQEQNLNFADFARETGMSVSYLNEIEKGKKFPKQDKIETLAKALGTTPEDLISPKLSKSLSPLGELLSSNFLNELPLDLFGIELSKVVEIIANAPVRVGAFISTLLELSRNYALGEENFYYGALRSYLEMHNNYFSDLEDEVANFVQKHKLPTTGLIPVQQLSDLLVNEYGYTIVENGLSPYPDLAEIRSLTIPASKKMLLNGELTEMQKAFQFGKELGFNYLNLKERANTSSLLRVHSFEEVLNHFKAAYFSAALLINRESFIEDLKAFFSQPKWKPEIILQMLDKYQASPEMLFQRLSNVLPQFFNIESILLLRFIHTPATDQFRIDKELHLSRRHRPHANFLSEHYCRRWISVSLLKELEAKRKTGIIPGPIAGIQRSHFIRSDDEYLSFTIAKPAYPSPDKNISITVGIVLDKSILKKIDFAEDASIPRKQVHTTCERCPIDDCSERAAPQSVVVARKQMKKVQALISKLIEEG